MDLILDLFGFHGCFNFFDLGKAFIDEFRQLLSFVDERGAPIDHLFELLAIRLLSFRLVCEGTHLDRVKLAVD